MNVLVKTNVLVKKKRVERNVNVMNLMNVVEIVSLIFLGVYIIAYILVEGWKKYGYRFTKRS